MSNSFSAAWLAVALVRCQAAIRSGRTRMRPSFCSTLYAMACTSLATVAGIVCSVGIELVRASDARCYSVVQQRALVILLLDHIQHLHQRVWAVARSLSGQGNEMTPRQERRSLRTCTHTHHIRFVLGEIGGVFPGHGRHTGPTVFMKTVRAELAPHNYCRRVFHRVGLVVDQSDSHSSSPTLTKRPPGQ